MNYDLELEEKIRSAEKEVEEAKKRYDFALKKLNHLQLLKQNKNLPNPLKGTDQLNSELNNITNDEGIRRFLKENRKILYETYSDWLNGIMEEKHITVSDLLEKVSISKSFLYDVKNGDKKPTKETVIKIGLALGLSLEEMNRSLKLAEWKELYPKKRDDAIIIDGINRGKTVHQIDQALKMNGGSITLLDKD